jgi:erythromycin esterase-like protein
MGATDVDLIRSERLPVRDGVPDDDVLFELVGDAHFVLLGEASHGTREFYAARAHMTQRLIEERGFTAVAVEADWPDAYRVNRYVRGRSNDSGAEEALRGFERFPQWMWRNDVVVDFVSWLRRWNAGPAGPGAVGPGSEAPRRVGFYGLDLYSLHRSAREVIAYLERVDPAAAVRARERYSCFDHASAEDGQSYGYAAAFGAGESCQRHAIEQLLDMRSRLGEYAGRDGAPAEDEAFYAEQNARLVVDAEEYYRTMFGGRVSSWNLRDTHMADTLEALAAHLGRQQGTAPRIVVWEHNSHLGDARATELGEQGELNVGQLVRDRHADDCVSIGFTTYRGTVTAADDWDGPAERKRVRPALDGSVEALFHAVGDPAFLLSFGRNAPPAGAVAGAMADMLRAPRLERAIGVIYRPRTERQSHYFRARVADQFDAVIHLDETGAVQPLERTGRWDAGEVPETFPVGV